MTTYIEKLESRYTAKKFTPNIAIPPSILSDVKKVLQLSPSSTNSQPWHFVIATSQESKDKIAASARGFYEFNAGKIKDASAVVVLCTKTTIDTDYTNAILAQEEKDGRFPTNEVREMNRKGREFFVLHHRDTIQDAQHWMEKQTFIALGNLLIGAEHLGLQACPMEGFDYDNLTERLGLAEKGLAPTVIVSLGYGADDDFNASAPKSRMPQQSVITEI
ncbi:MAG: oxygen-insensitive NAD(P)H nitroreductase [Halodesulfovibrio sp.]|uniref:oxygen-insensitive NAD(P)H nitroreductase n=1 Tax=Halodesulfovibrio sp. TaxID=1912772 RepID=UPI00359EC33A